MTAPTPTAATPPDAPAPDPQQRLAHLFRHSLRAGQLHPLLHLVERYRGETGGST